MGETYTNMNLLLFSKQNLSDDKTILQELYGEVIMENVEQPLIWMEFTNLTGLTNNFFGKSETMY